MGRDDRERHISPERPDCLDVELAMYLGKQFHR